MKKHEFKLYENEEMVYDVDDLMEQELVKFKEQTKDLNDENICIFVNWVKAYKILNYDIFEELKIENIYKFSESSAIVELTFKNVKEFDILYFNKDNMTVGSMNVKNNKVRTTVIRRSLIPETVEEALMFARSSLNDDGIKQVAKTMKELNDSINVFTISNEEKIQLGLEVKEEKVEENKEEVKEEKVEENKEEKVEENKEEKVEENKEEVKEEKVEENKEEVKEEKVEENKEEVKEEKVEELIHDFNRKLSSSERFVITFAKRKGIDLSKLIG